MKRKKIIPAVILVLITAGAIIYFDVIRKIDISPNAIDGTGTIEVTEIDIAAKVAGRIIDISASEGDRIRKNAPLVNLSYDELAPQKISAAANLTNAEKSFSRAKALYTSGSLSKQSYDNALTAYTNAQSQYQYILANIANSYIHSPIDGIVMRKNAERGELAFPGTPILVIADISKPWIKIYVPETKIGRVRHGDTVECTTDSFPGKKFSGRIVSISNKAEFTPKTIQTKEERVKLVFAVKASLDNPDELLKPGMPADITVKTRPIK